MSNFLRTTIAFTKNLSQTGAFGETSRFVVREISRHVDSTHPQLILEYGAGHGNISRGILHRMHPASRLLAFEINPEFCEVLREIDDPRLTVINASVNDIDQYVTKEDQAGIDAVISSVPITFLTKEESDQLIARSFELLRPGGWMSQVLYTIHHLPKFKKHFKRCTARMVWNVPPAFVYQCQK